MEFEFKPDKKLIEALGKRVVFPYMMVGEGYLRCPRCGYSFEVDYLDDQKGEWPLNRYCPHCGLKIGEIDLGDLDAD